MPSRIAAVLTVTLACLAASLLECWLTSGTTFLEAFLSNLLPAFCGGFIVWLLLWSLQPVPEPKPVPAASLWPGESIDLVTPEDGFTLRDAAWHEAAHVVANWHDPESPHVSMVRVSRQSSTGQIVGYTLYSGYRFMTRSQMMGFLTGVMAGGVADEMRLGQPTTGVGADLKLASSLAEEMVRRFGFGRGSLGRRTFPLSQEGRTYSRETAAQLDQEIRHLMSEARKRARRAIKSHLQEMYDLTEALMRLGIMDDRMIAGVIGPWAVKE